MDEQNNPLRQWRLRRGFTLSQAAEYLSERRRGARYDVGQLSRWERGGPISEASRLMLELITQGAIKADAWPETKATKKKIARRSAAKLVQASEAVRAASKRLHLHTDAALADGVLTDDEMTRLSSDRDDLDRAEREFDSACGVCSDG